CARRAYSTNYFMDFW
nr:immunoglobulin heavy chain junction region [Mus musculus]MBK4187426.1 immunoglobulin heavy chain junction region [Mus musculus]